MKNFLVFLTMIAFLGFALTSCGGGEVKAPEAKQPEKKEEVKKTEPVKEETAKTEAPKTFTANLENGKAVYDKICMACHLMGVSGAPGLKPDKLKEDKPRWEAIAAKGMATLHQHAIKGFQGEHGVMPEKGSCMDCSDQDLYDGISFMLNKAGVTPK